MQKQYTAENQPAAKHGLIGIETMPMLVINPYSLNGNTGQLLSRFDSNELTTAQGRNLLDPKQANEQFENQEIRRYSSSEEEDQETKNLKRR